MQNKATQGLHQASASDACPQLIGGRWRAPGAHQRRNPACGSGTGAGAPAPPPPPQPESSTEEGGGWRNLALTGVMLALYAALMTYVVVYAPNQTPVRDTILLQKLVNLLPEEPYVPNPIFVAVFNLLGVYPAIFSALLIPGARSAKGIPAWPFVTVSFGLGCYALLPYMLLWEPKRDQQLPPPKAELEGVSRLLLRANETPWVPAALLAAALALLVPLTRLPPGAVLDYVHLFDESRLVHASSLDFVLFTALAPYWMYNDAEGRGWEPRDKLVPVLSFLPVVGPLVYLILRPKGGQE